MVIHSLRILIRSMFNRTISWVCRLAVFALKLWSDWIGLVRFVQLFRICTLSPQLMRMWKRFPIRSVRTLFARRNAICCPLSLAIITQICLPCQITCCASLELLMVFPGAKVRLSCGTFLLSMCFPVACWAGKGIHVVSFGMISSTTCSSTTVTSKASTSASTVTKACR